MRMASGSCAHAPTFPQKGGRMTAQDLNLVQDKYLTTCGDPSLSLGEEFFTVHHSLRQAPANQAPRSYQVEHVSRRMAGR